MINGEILSKIGGGAAGAVMYQKIAEWEAWWKGYERTFHEYYENSVGGGTVKREMYRMNMAKKVCEDWAALLLNDRVKIRVDDEVGEAFVGKVLGETDFTAHANRLVEKAFATGTGAAILRLGAVLDENGEFTGGDEVAFEFVDASHIVPISVQNGKITEAAFMSMGKMRGEDTLYVEEHLLEEDGYVIKNRFYVRKEGEFVQKQPEFCPEEIRLGSHVPLFSILTPNISNNVDAECGLGVSVFADAVDCLRGVDLAFNNFCRDIKLGGKKVFIDRSLIVRDDSGNIFTPDDVAQQLFVPIGDGDFSDKPMIVEHNPELRAEENAAAVQCQLDYLSFRCGLGAHHYSFAENGSRAKLTATQYMGERQDMRQNTVKHQKSVEKFLRGVVRALLWCASDVMGLPCDKTAAVGITFDDSYFADSLSERNLDLSEVEAGVFRSKNTAENGTEVCDMAQSETGCRFSDLEGVFGEQKLSFGEFCRLAMERGVEIGDVGDMRREMESEIFSVKVDHRLEREMEKAGVKNKALVERLIDRGAITLDNGEICGIGEQIESLKQSDPYLFESRQPTYRVKTGLSHTRERVDPEGMTDTDYYKNVKGI